MVTKWDKSRVYEVHGQVKYNGINTGSIQWKSGTILVHYVNGHWKIEVKCHTATTSCIVNTLSPATISKSICKAQLVITLLQDGLTNHITINFKPVNYDTKTKESMNLIHYLIQDIDSGMFETERRHNPSEVTLCNRTQTSPVGRLTNVDQNRQSNNAGNNNRYIVAAESPEKLTRLKQRPDSEESKENELRAYTPKDSKKFLENGMMKAQECLEMKTSGFYGKTSENHRNFGSFSLNSSLKRTPGLMPDPTPQKRPRLLSDTSIKYSWTKPQEPSKSQQSDQQTKTFQGFSNLGNTCYMNAILQALFNLDTFKADLFNCSRRMMKTQPNQSLYYALTKLLKSRSRNVSDFVRREMLRNVKSAISSTAKRFLGFQQHDAHEFLGQVLDQLKEEVSKVLKSTPSPRKENSATVHHAPEDLTMHNFTLEVEHIISCNDCGEIVAKTEQFNDLSLDLPRHRKNGDKPSVQNALDFFFHKEDIEYTCEKCGCTKAVVMHKFTKLPRVLIIHLKRYTYDQIIERQSKVGQNVEITRFLTLQAHCEDDTRPAFPPMLNVPPEYKTTNDNPSTGTHRKLELSDSFRFKKTSPLTNIGQNEEQKETMRTSTPFKRSKSFDLETSEHHIKADMPITLTDDPTQEDKDLAKALELSLQETKQPPQIGLRGDNPLTVEDEEEDPDLVRALELSLKEANERIQGYPEEAADYEYERALELSRMDSDRIHYPMNEDRLSYKEEDMSSYDIEKDYEVGKKDISGLENSYFNNVSQTSDSTPSDQNDTTCTTTSEKSETSVSEETSFAFKVNLKSKTSEILDLTKEVSATSDEQEINSDLKENGAVLSWNSEISGQGRLTSDEDSKNSQQDTSADEEGKTAENETSSSATQTQEPVQNGTTDQRSRKRLECSEATTEDKGDSEEDFKLLCDDEDDFQLFLMEDKENANPSSEDMDKPLSRPAPAAEETEKYIELPEVNNKNGDLPYSYRLVSIVNHVGSSSVAGHYVSDVYDIRKKSWFSCDDSHVTKTTEDEVLARRERTGYIFFYLSKDIYEEVKENLALQSSQLKNLS